MSEAEPTNSPHPCHVAKTSIHMNSFRTENVTNFAGAWSMSYCFGGRVPYGAQAKRVFGKRLQYERLFTYLFRRFGPQQYGCDGHKDLTIYILTTPDPQVHLVVAPNPSQGLSFGYAITQAVSDELHEWTRGPWQKWFSAMAEAFILQFKIRRRSEKEGVYFGVHTMVEHYRVKNGLSPKKDQLPTLPKGWEKRCTSFCTEYIAEHGLPPARRHDPLDLRSVVSGSPHARILAALEISMRDLLRPTNIRDCYISALGRCDPPPENGDDDTAPSEAARRFEFAGQGMPARLLAGGDAFHDVAHELERLSRNNPRRGMAKALCALKTLRAPRRTTASPKK